MRVLVCGGRAYHDEAAVHRALDALEGVTLVIDGGASGADLWARRWAKNNTVANETFIAEWGRHGRSAGPRRNSAMLALGKPDLVLAFPGDRGTRDMVAKAIKAGVRVVEPEVDVKETPESEHVGETCKPVAWAYVNTDGECEQIEWGGLPNDPSITPLYLHPPRKLPTREEVKVAIEDAIYSGGQSAFLEHATNAIMALFDAPHGAGGE